MSNVTQFRSQKIPIILYRNLIMQNTFCDKHFWVIQMSNSLEITYNKQSLIQNYHIHHSKYLRWNDFIDTYETYQNLLQLLASLKDDFLFCKRFCYMIFLQITSLNLKHFFCFLWLSIIVYHYFYFDIIYVYLQLGNNFLFYGRR